MIVLLGASGYIGQAFARELTRRDWEFLPLSRRQLDYSRFDTLLKFLRDRRPSFLINAAGYTGHPNMDACEAMRAETLQANTLLPVTIAHACAAADTPWGHVSSAGMYDGAWIVEDGTRRVERNQNALEAQSSDPHTRGQIVGFNESDEPNFSFRHPPCSFYCGSKALAEEAVLDVGESYLWRIQMPFDPFDAPKNYLAKLLRYPKLRRSVDSLSHRGDCVRASLELWARRAAFGTYNVTNPGFVTTRRIVSLMQAALQPGRDFQFFADDDEFYREAARAPRSNCVLDVSKLLSTGVELRPVEDALLDALQNWQPAKV